MHVAELNTHWTDEIWRWSTSLNMTKVHQSTLLNVTEVGRSFLSIPRRSWRTLVPTKFHIFSTKEILFSAKSHLFGTKQQQPSWPKFLRPFRHTLGAKPKLFGQLWHHFHLFDAEEIPFSAISHLFGTKLYHPSWQKIGRSFFGFFGMLRHARRQAKVFFAYFGVTWCQATLFDLFQYCLHLYSTLAWWISM